MPAWRLGRFIGSLLVLAGLAVGGFAASAGAVGWSERSGVTASELPDDSTAVTTPGSAFQSFGFEWG
ncbi:hypothetical protein I0C86_21010 [Plantactinospora sp. S1510]|uniref:Uncharacterized protein n=1 Tax=Plantactinospora alkalitolerans TaxID=2789879 RepID=A0ABS0GZP0_9ACTN|nr:hypothetical protein [Plantactinospora alkalitolerans]MBF9131423.1 hypothetical protein [Plantactinospora alkalitolerans]